MHSKGTIRFILQGILLAIALVGMAVAGRAWPLQALGSGLTYITFYPAVIIAALCRGIVAGSVATFLSCVALVFLWPMFADRPFIQYSADWLGMAVFVLNGLVISGIAEAMRRTHVGLRQAQMDLQRSHVEIRAARDASEEEVRARTADLRQAKINLERELTERKRAEEELRKAHGELEQRVQERTAELEDAKEAVMAEPQRLYNVLETLPVYVCLLDSNYQMPFANRYFRETFGEPRGRRCHEFLFGRVEPCEICETYTVMKTREPHHWYWTGPNGRDYDIYDFPFTDNDGSFLILEMGIDITERKQAEDALKQTLADLTGSNEDLERFAYVASHDLQEPLRNVAGCLQMLEKKYRNNLDAEADKYIGYAVESVVRMKDLIRDLLAYSRIGTRGKPPQQVDCRRLLTRTLKNLASALSESGATVTHDPLPTISGDDTQVLQVFQNLIQNAVKFRRDEAPRIHLSAVKNNNEWVFSVKDNGLGIESRHLERIFVIFQRLQKRSEYQGTGMGLAIVKKVVERHGGRVWVESEPGVGSTFYFTMPEKGIAR